MELRHLRYFVAVAEEGNIRRAAARLHVVQPALSRQIRQLEEELGYALFDRLPRGVRLNAVGREFIVSARQVLEAAEAAVDRARRAGAGETGRLRVGFIESAAWAGVFPKAIQRYRRRYPDVGLELRTMFSTDQLAAVAADDLDGGFCYPFAALPAGCRSLTVRRDEAVLAVPSRSAWKKRKRVRLEDLRREAFVAVERGRAPAYVDRITAAAYAGGLSPRVVQEAADETTLLGLVSAGIGVGFCNSANLARKPQYVDFVRLADFELELNLCFVWKEANTSAALAAFRAAVEAA